MKKIYSYFLLLGLIILGLQVQASHLMGADFTYKYVSKSGSTVTYKVTMRVFRDCNSSSGFPSTAAIGIYYANNNSSYGTLTLNRASGYSTEKSITPTCISSSGLCIAEMLYENTISFPTSNTTGFYLCSQSCCRTNAIQNLSNPGTTGMGWKLYVPPPSGGLYNSSVEFSTKPLPFICSGDTISFNHLAFDADGDSFTYKLVTPYASSGAGGGIVAASPSLPSVSYAGGYSSSSPLGSNNWVGIDTFTGELRIFIKAGTSITGVLSVEINEYRKNANGTVTYVGTSRRDLQIIAKPCSNYNPPKFVIPSGYNSSNYYSQSVNVFDTLCFNISAYDSQGDSLYFSRNGAIFDGSDGLCSPYATLDQDTVDSAITRKFCWSPGCCRAGQTAIFTVNVADNNCGSKEVTFAIKVNGFSRPNPPKIRCADIIDNSTIKLTWDSSSSKYVNRYLIYRKTTGSFVKIDSVYTGTYTYTNTGVSNALSTQYQYMIKAVNNCDSISNGDTITTIKVTATKTFNYLAVITWSALRKTSPQPRYFRLYKSDDAGNWIYLDSTTNDTFLYYGAKCKDSLMFRITAVDSSGCESRSMQSAKLMIEDVLPPAIMGFSRVTVTTSGKVKMDFDKNDSSDAVLYVIYKKNPGDTGFTQYRTIKSTGAATYTLYDSSVNVNGNPQLPCYKVNAIDSCGNVGSLYEEHCPVNLRGTPGNLINVLKWRNYYGFDYDSFYVMRYDTNGIPVRLKRMNSGDTTFTDTGLICARTYTYVLLYKYFQNDSNIWSESDTLKLTPYDTLPPEPPAIKYVSVLHDSAVGIWFYPTNSTDVNYYDIYRKTNGGTAQKIATLNYPKIVGGIIYYKDSSALTLANRYCYYIITRDSCSNLNSKASDVHCDIQLKGNAGNNRGYITWMKYTGIGIKNYKLNRYGASGWTTIQTLNGNDSIYTDSTGVNCSLNIYQVIGLDSTGNILSYSDTVWIHPYDTQPPLKIQIRKVTVLNRNQIYLHWTGTSSDVNRIILYRSVGGGSMQVYDTLTANDTSYTDTNVDCAYTFYSYSVEPFDSCNSLTPGKSAIHTSILLYKKMDFCQKKLDLYWSKYSGWSNGVNKYILKRSVNGGTFVDIANVTPADTHYLDTVSFGRNYTYKLVAEEKNGNYETSEGDTISFFFRPVKGPQLYSASKIATSNTSGQVEIKFDVIYYDSLVKFAQLYYSSTGSSGSFSLLKDSIPVGATSFIHTGINTRTQDHYYYMINRDTCGDLTDSNSLHKTINLSVIQKKIRNKLYWTAYHGYQVGYYIIERKDSGGMVDIDTIPGTDTAYIDFPSPCNGYVSYRVSAIDTLGQFRAFSDSVTIPPIDTIAKDSGAIYNVTVLNDTIIYVEFYAKDSSDIYVYALKKSINGGTFQTSRVYPFWGPGYQYLHYDTVDALHDEHEFELYTVDSCLNATPSKIFKPIQLRGIRGHLKNNLYFNKFVGYPIGYYELYTWDGSNWNLLDSMGPNDTSFTHNNLLCNIPIKYKIQGYEITGDQRVTVSDTLWLAPYDSIAPDSVTLKYVSVVDYNSITGEFKAGVPDVGSYELWIKSSSGTWSLNAVVSKTDTQFVISGLNTHDSVYEVKVLAVDSCAGNKSLFSNPHSPVLLQGVPLNNAVSLNWNSYRGFNIQQVVLQKYINGSWTQIFNAGGNTGYTDTALGCGSLNYYRIKSTSNSGRISFSDSVLLIPFDTVKPEPTTLRTLQYTASGYKISWNASPSPDVTQYNIYRSIDGGNFTQISNVFNQLDYIDSGSLDVNHTYCYYVRCVDSCSNVNISIPSDTDCTISLSHYSSGCFSQVILYWNAWQGFTNGINKYIIEKTDTLGNYVSIVVNKDSSAYHDINVISDMKYIYRVLAISNNASDTFISYPYAATPFIYPLSQDGKIYFVTVANSSNTLGSNKIVFRRNNPTDTLSKGYYLYYSNSGTAGSYTRLADITNLDDTVYIHDSINSLGGRHFYYTEIYDLCDRTGNPSSVHSPVLLSVNPGNLKNDIVWTHYQGWDVSSYEIYRSWTQGGNNFNTLLTSTDSGTYSYTDTSVSCDVDYTYIINSYEMLSTVSSKSNYKSGYVVDTIPPPPVKIYKASVITTSDNSGEIEIQFEGATERNRSGYRIFKSINGSAFNPLNPYPITLTGLLTYTDKNLDTRYSIYSYYITVTDSCGNESAPSDTHTVINTDVLSLNDQVQITWTPYHGFSPGFIYQIDRMDSTQTQWTTLTSLTDTASSFIDSTTRCNTIYYYRVAALPATGSTLITYSDTLSALTFEYNPPEAAEIIKVTVVKTSDWNGIVKLEYKASVSPDAYSYSVERRLKDDTAWVQIGYSYNQGSFTDVGLNTQDTVYYYRIRTIDSCGNISTYSLVDHATLNARVTPAEQSIIVSWNTYTGWPVISYNLYREGIFVSAFDSSIHTYLDTPLTCSQYMHYYVEAVNALDNSVKSRSDSAAVRPFDHTPPNTSYLVSASVEHGDDQVKLTWSKSNTFDISYYEIYRKYSGTNGWTKIHATTNADTIYFDNPGHLTGPLCYRITAADSCSNISNPSNDACIVFVQGRSNHLRHDIYWTNYIGWKYINRYEVWRSEDQEPEKLLWTIPADSLSLIDTLLANQVENFCYRVKAIEDSSQYNAYSWSNRLCLFQQPIYWIPNTFTPNGDGLNDTFAPVGLYIKHYEMKIYNRWGQEIFSGEGKNPKWPGTTENGSAQAAGVYMYRIRFYSIDDRIYDVPGTIILLR